jgi:hypothetical protein
VKEMKGLTHSLKLLLSCLVKDGTQVGGLAGGGGGGGGIAGWTSAIDLQPYLGCGVSWSFGSPQLYFFLPSNNATLARFIREENN